MGDRNRVVMVSSPQKEGLAVPDGAKLAAVIETASGKEIKRYVDTAGNQPLLDKIPDPGKIIKTNTKEAYGITEWELSNGLKVVPKPTNNKRDEIVFRATSPGGTSLASDEDYIPASTADQVIPAGGLGKFSAIELRKVLSGKVASVRPYIGETDEGLSGSASLRLLPALNNRTGYPRGLLMTILVSWRSKWFCSSRSSEVSQKVRPATTRHTRAARGVGTGSDLPNALPSRRSPPGLPAFQYAWEVSLRQAAYVVMDPWARDYEARVMPGMRTVIKEVKTWPLVLQAGRLRYSRIPTANKAPAYRMPQNSARAASATTESSADKGKPTRG